MIVSHSCADQTRTNIWARTDVPAPVHNQAPAPPVREMFAIEARISNHLWSSATETRNALSPVERPMDIEPRPTRVHPPIGEQTFGPDQC
jgi:hypothetical protein